MTDTARPAVWSPWLTARAIVLGSLALAHYSAGHLGISTAARSRVRDGLLGWDAGWYLQIAQHGYGPRSSEALRFFPLFPMAARLLHDVTRLPVGPCLVLIANASALTAGYLLHRLVRAELPEPGAAHRSVWALFLAPPALCLVLGYSDALLITLGIATFLAVRTQRWGWAIPLGAAAGLSRPVGILLCVPVFLEASRGILFARSLPDSDATGPGRTGDTVRGAVTPVSAVLRAASCVAPAAGATAFLAWSAVRYGDFWKPLSIQTAAGHRGGLVDPVSTLLHDTSGILHGRHIGSGLHVPWVLAALALLVVAARRLPVSYSAYAAVTLAVALASSNLDSFERYALDAFPLVIAAGCLHVRPATGRVALALSSAGLLGYSLLVFTGAYVP